MQIVFADKGEPVTFFEHKMLYGLKEEVDDGDGVALDGVGAEVVVG